MLNKYLTKRKLRRPGSLHRRYHSAGEGTYPSSLTSAYQCPGLSRHIDAVLVLRARSHYDTHSTLDNELSKHESLGKDAGESRRGGERAGPGAAAVRNQSHNDTAETEPCPHRPAPVQACSRPPTPPVPLHSMLLAQSAPLMSLLSSQACSLHSLLTHSSFTP